LFSFQDFENLTIAHVPDKIWNPGNETTNTTTMVSPIQGQLWVPGVSSRTLLVVICSCIIYIYTCYLVWHEWVDNLALRRVYFLESEHYPRRIKELDEITAIQNIIPEDPVQEERPPYIPDPELRDTPPSVGLYSVLYQLPESLVTYDTDGATQLERQIVATTSFFDECVPAQPGFSSSVAAVTIIPDASRVAKAWMKWYKIETKLRRLRFIRKLIRHKLEMEAEGRTDIYDNIAHVMKKSKHGLDTATHTVTTAVASTASATGRQLTAALSASVPLSQNRSGSMNNEPVPESAINEESIETQEQQPLVVSNNDNSESSNQDESTVDFVVKGSDNDKASDSNPKEEQTIKDNKTKDASAEEGNLFVSLWSKWMGGENETTNDKVNDDIEMQPINSPTDAERRKSGARTMTASTSTGSSTIQSRTAQVKSPEEVEGVRDFFYEDFDVKAYARKLGFDEETELHGIVDGLGIEELSIFAREYSQSSANPCVYGMFEMFALVCIFCSVRSCAY
jgi:hypothetical protein